MYVKHKDVNTEDVSTIKNLNENSRKNGWL